MHRSPAAAFSADGMPIFQRSAHLPISVVIAPPINYLRFMSRTDFESLGRKPQKYCHISRFSDNGFRYRDKQKIQ